MANPTRKNERNVERMVEARGETHARIDIFQKTGAIFVEEVLAGGSSRLIARHAPPRAT